ncbi:MAG: hypothetical protein ACE14L_01555 [Terriglobales bacterium]
MYCNRCGAPLDPQQTVCSCGATQPTSVTQPAVPPSAGPAPPTMTAERLAWHLRLLGIFWIIVAFLWLIPAGILYGIGTAAGVVIPAHEPGAEIARQLGPLVMYSIGGLLALIGVLCFGAGWGLMNRRDWARTLAIVLGVISLFHPPFGTALGIYTLWVLLSSGAATEYERLANR